MKFVALVNKISWMALLLGAAGKMAFGEGASYLYIVAALLLAVFPPLIRVLLLGLSADFGVWAYRALSFLVASCPCALVISIPLSFFGGLGGASKAGILSDTTSVGWKWPASKV